MPLQNRVDPFGRLHANPARGLFTGNRGVIHDPGSRILTGRRWTTKAWIVCSRVFQGRKRDVWGRNRANGGVGWTELFFLDEVTALAAGHRPCFFCRRDAATAFARSFGDGNGLDAPKAPEIDARLHRERRFSAWQPPRRLFQIDLSELPDGTVVEADGNAFAVREHRALPWSFAGYGEPRAFSTLSRAPLCLITPPSTVAALRAGLRLVWHDSARR